MDLNKYYNSSWHDLSFKNIQKLGLDRDNKLIFDVGAGNSILKDRINKTGAHWIGFDYIPREDYINKWDVEKEIVEVENKPDCILFLEVIEHLFNPGIALQNISKVAKEGSYIIITTPNPNWTINRIKFFLLGIFPNFTRQDMDDNHHVFTVWPHIMEKLLKDNEFKILDSCTLSSKASFPKLTFKPVYFVRILLYIARKIIEIIDPTSKGMCYGVVAIKESNYN